MKSIFILVVLTALASSSAFANQCFQSNITPDFGEDYASYSVDIPSYICVKHARAIVENPRSATVESTVIIGVETDDTVGLETKKVTARTYSVTPATNGEYILSYDLLSDSDGSFCDRNVGYNIRVKIKFNQHGIAKELINLNGYAYSTWDNCHDTSPETIDLEYETVNYRD